MLLLSLIPKELMQARINTSAHVPLKGECVINPPLFPPNLDTCEQREKKRKKKKIKNHYYCLLLLSVTVKKLWKKEFTLTEKNISSNQLFI